MCGRQIVMQNETPGPSVAAGVRTLASVCVLALILLLMAHPVSGALAGQEISRKELQADITEAYDILKRYHPNLTAHKTRKQLDALHNRVVASVPAASTTEQALVTLSELVAAVCDSHTTLSRRSSINKVRSGGWPWYGLQLFVQDGKLYMETSDGATKEEIISINDVAGPDIASALTNRISGDGCFKDSILLVAERLPLSGFVVGELIGFSGPYIVKSRPRGSGGIRTHTVEDVNYYSTVSSRAKFKQAQFNQMKVSLFVEDFEQQQLGADTVRARLDYWFSSRRNIAYLRIGAFEERKTAEKGIELVMRDVISKNPDLLVVDLSGNPGGRTLTAQLFMAFLLPRAHRLVSKTYVRNSSNKRASNFQFAGEQAKDSSRSDVRFFRRLKSRNGLRTANVRKRSFGKPDYKGPVYILLSPQSHSAALHVATNLKRLRNARIFGSVAATDTVTSCNSAFGKFTLQHSRIRLSVPERCSRHPGNRFNEEHTLVPDIEVGPMDGPLVELKAAIFEAALDDFEAGRAR